MTDHGAGPDQPGHEHERSSGAPGGGADGVGDLGEEAARLLGVLAGFTRSVDEHVATGAPECQWCPVCRAVHVVRSASPEVREHLSTAASSLLQAAASLLASTGAPRDAEPGPGGATPDDGLEHIDLDPEEDS
ncbi:hypothetical protein [Nocardioides sp. CFH 31398]|uniref:hypothetical protein n=1 Tax=Nocardioides sp. CFH 31398 TaxID=2919579 RepID=UPI001F0521A2|nr:hypothetical protein [Nocardioides sp. CFH 31398]MCH1868230.1 hypothetical protein [Nocardioides sp. CFH 31398]